MLKGALIFASSITGEKAFVFTIEKTDSMIERTRGLLGHPELGPTEGLWITPCNSIHTFGMKYKLDIVYINRYGKVKKVIEHLSPHRVSFCFGAQSVIELQAGAIEKAGIQIDQSIEWIEERQ